MLQVPGGEESGAVALPGGGNVFIAVVVLADDGQTQRTYTIDASRAPLGLGKPTRRGSVSMIDVPG